MLTVSKDETAAVILRDFAQETTHPPRAILLFQSHGTPDQPRTGDRGLLPFQHARSGKAPQRLCRFMLGPLLRVIERKADGLVDRFGKSVQHLPGGSQLRDWF